LKYRPTVKYNTRENKKMLQHIHRLSNALAGFSESSSISQLPVAYYQYAYA